MSAAGVPRGIPDGLAPRNVLVVESSTQTADMLTAALHLALPQAHMHVAGLLVQARLLLRSVRPGLVLANLGMIENEVEGFIADVGACRRGARVVLVAGHGRDDRILPALRKGAAGFVVKNDRPDIVRSQIEAILAGAPLLSPVLAAQFIRQLDRFGLTHSLTGPQRELLTWLASGDTPGEAAQRMLLDEVALGTAVRQIYALMGLGAAASSQERGNGQGGLHG
jgi:DNA-binding NarL/FixJ family response regulator